MIGFTAFTVLALFFKGGGGDIIMMTVVGFMLGPVILMHITIAASVFSIIYYYNSKKTQIPYAPCVFLGYIFCFLGGYLYAINDYRILGLRYFLL